MSFELKTHTDTEGVDSEVIIETVTKSHQTTTTWSKNALQKEITSIQETIAAHQTRLTVLEEQLARFAK